MLSQLIGYTSNSPQVLIQDPKKSYIIKLSIYTIIKNLLSGGEEAKAKTIESIFNNK